MSIRFDGTGADNLNRAISFSADTGTIMAWIRIVTDRNAFTSFFNPRQTANQEVLIQTDATGTLLGLWQANVMSTGTTSRLGSGITWQSSTVRAPASFIWMASRTSSGRTLPVP